MKKILITLLLLITSTNISSAQGLLDNVLDAAQAINCGVPPSAILRDSAYDYAQQQINNTQQNTQNQNNYYQPAQYQNQQYQTNTQYQEPQANPYQNVNADTSTEQYSAPAQNSYSENTQSYNGDFAIKPFANITFYDGLMDVINKLRAMPSVTEIYLDYDELLPIKPLKSGNLKNIPNEQLVSAVKSYLTKETYNAKIYNLTDKNGKTGYYHSGYAKITAKTIMLENTPFELEIRFLPHEAMVVNAPNKVVKDSRGYYPLYLDQIWLTSNSYLTKDNWQMIDQACKNKFAILLNNLSETDAMFVSDKKWQIHDKHSNRFSFEYKEDNNNCELTYSSDNYKNYLDNLYKQHLKQIDSQKYKEVPNSQI